MDYFKQRRAYRNYKVYEEDVSIGQNNLYRELLDYANDYGKSFDFFPLKNSALASLTGLSESGLKAARNRLIQNKLIEYKPGKKQVSNPRYRIVQLYEEYPKKSGSSVSGGAVGVSQAEPQPVTQAVSHKYLLVQDNNSTTTTNKKNKEKDSSPYNEVVSYLNEKAKTNFRSGSESTKKLIHARFSEGFSLVDFKKVIDNKVSTWKGTEWEKFLRPATLFGNKFESYLNEKPTESKFKAGPKKKEVATDWSKKKAAVDPEITDEYLDQLLSKIEEKPKKKEEKLF